jgi:hypothetical protein
MILDNDNFLNYAMRHYDNPSCKTLDDFNEDVNRFVYVRKLLRRYEKIDIRLLLNHIIILYNVFENEACTAMLFFKIDKQHWEILASILDFLNYLPEVILPLNINTELIKKDEKTLGLLNEICR